MDLSTLTKVLGISYRPPTCPATVTGYKCKLWGQYPALVDEPLGETISGVAYEIQSQDEKTGLETYEGDSYALEGCLIKFENGTRMLGLTFKWKGDLGVLKDDSFDLRDWQTRDFA
ncbi:MAG: hypothetical protein M1839_000900 [Geoglossum umbratile]|nr:MAG: hypothetical protein M1839_000900 [Geoglossum umbratile]